MGILRYSETSYFLDRYFTSLIMKLKLKFKEKSKKKHADKIVKAHLSYALFLNLYSLNVKQCEHILVDMKNGSAFESIRNYTSSHLISKVKCYLNMILFQKYQNKKFMEEANRIIKEELPPHSEYIACTLNGFDDSSN